jgi:cell division protein FtsA
MVGKLDKEGSIKIIGMGIVPTRGLKKGLIVNIDIVTNDIKEAVKEAEKTSELEISSVFMGIGGEHIKTVNSKGSVPVRREDREITIEDTRNVIETAKAIALPEGREIIQVLPQDFVIDGQPEIKDPIGMNGVKLEITAHIVEGMITHTQNFIKSVNQAGFKIEDIVFNLLASSESVLSQSEKELGIVLIEMGAGTTNCVIFEKDSLKHSQVLAIGGNHITNDIAIGLHISTPEAEKIKKKYGVGLDTETNNQDNPNHFSPYQFSEIVQLRIAETVRIVKEEIERADFINLIASGVVLTGGGSLLKGMTSTVRDIFNLPTRIGVPNLAHQLGDIPDKPSYSTCIGLLQHGSDFRKFGEQ